VRHLALPHRHAGAVPETLLRLRGLVVVVPARAQRRAELVLVLRKALHRQRNVTAARWPADSVNMLCLQRVSTLQVALPHLDDDGCDGQVRTEVGAGPAAKWYINWYSTCQCCRILS